MPRFGRRLEASVQELVQVSPELFGSSRMVTLDTAGRYHAWAIPMPVVTTEELDRTTGGRKLS